jgi:hypothetical protein
VETATGKVAATLTGRLVGGRLSRVTVRSRLAPGRYRLRVSLVAAVNRGPRVNLASPSFYTTNTR